MPHICANAISYAYNKLNWFEPIPLLVVWSASARAYKHFLGDRVIRCVGVDKRRDEREREINPLKLTAKRPLISVCMHRTPVTYIVSIVESAQHTHHSNGEGIFAIGCIAVHQFQALNYFGFCVSRTKCVREQTNEMANCIGERNLCSLL